MISCPVCGTEDTLVYYPKDEHGPDMIICTDFGNHDEKPCKGQFTLDRKSVDSDWIKALVKSSCKGDSEFPCQEIQCPSCEALEDDELLFDADARDMHKDVDRTWEANNE